MTEEVLELGTRVRVRFWDGTYHTGRITAVDRSAGTGRLTYWVGLEAGHHWATAGEQVQFDPKGVEAIDD